MSAISDFFSWILVTLIGVWVLAMLVTSDQCTRVYRSSWPVVYGMTAAEEISKHWTTDETKLKMLRWKANGAVAVQTFFETTIYGETKKCTK
jgi:hypothetical protein